jgi:NADH dehydrogenase
VIGGGFGGLYAVHSLRAVPVAVTLLDRRNFHLFQPLLYQVATGGLSPANIATPLRSLLQHHKNAKVLLAEATSFDVAEHRVITDIGPMDYDTLIVAAGARHHYFGHPEWEAFAPGLKAIEDATEIRGRVLRAFEAAESATNPAQRQAFLTFVVVGGGPTGVELAGALGELAQFTLRRDFRDIDTRQARVLLLEGADRILTTFPPELSVKAVKQLTRLGVEVHTRSVVTDIKPGVITIKSGDNTQDLLAHTVLWGAGVQASSLGQKLALATGASLDRAGRVIVSPDLTIAEHPEIFVIGDLANVSHQTGSPLPGVAPVAMQAGRYAASVIQARLRGEILAPFHYRDKGNLATIGRAAAVADLGHRWLHFSGYLAWLMWLFVHILYLLKMENRLLVLVQWAWNYVTRNRAARLITGPWMVPHPPDTGATPCPTSATSAPVATAKPTTPPP